VASDQPLIIVQQPELPERLDQLGDGSERPHPKEVLFQGANEAFRDAIPLGLPDEGGELVIPG